MSTYKRRRTWADGLEEGFIALIMFAMTAITFAAVIAREADGTILWAYEATKILFAWLVLIGAAYAVKVNAHLGVDVVVNAMSSPLRRALTYLSLAVCLAWAVIFLVASFSYWWPFFVSAEWFDYMPEWLQPRRSQTWYEVDDIPMPWVLSWMSDVFNEGEPYEKMPRFIPYAVMPIAALLLLYRFIEAGVMIVRGARETLIASHEAEEMLEEVREREAAEAAGHGVPAEAAHPVGGPDHDANLPDDSGTRR